MEAVVSINAHPHKNRPLGNLLPIPSQFKILRKKNPIAQITHMLGEEMYNRDNMN